MPDSRGRWTTGERVVATAIEQRRLQTVHPSTEHAALLVEQAEQHLRTAALVVDVDPAGAFTMLYDAARKSMVAVLATQGLRPTARGGHRVVQDVLEAQLGPDGRTVVRRFRELRLRRHDSEYPDLDSQPVTSNQAREGLEDARSVVAAMERFIPLVGPW
ncbi:HEPN domain-containing protein [Cellulosimicrobium sp. Marseille-Q4280]|jgi:HEPN domain-containing protein|uniref:HEPN domain-containing protein n=1 Tax=Cellulosimicrobium sp. Marseille-Q4280 TaxID=2937992 RepID=UPI00203F15B5|nr:HEPN domain-containing protein [Cellulosimicrobium sp. Marseille-Q4280]